MCVSDRDKERDRERRRQRSDCVLGGDAVNGSSLFLSFNCEASEITLIIPGNLEANY